MLYFATMKGLLCLLHCNNLLCVFVSVCIQNDSTPLHEASGAGHAAIVQLLLIHGADLHAEDRVIKYTISTSVKTIQLDERSAADL